MTTPTKTDLLPEYVDRFDYGDGYVRHIDAPASIVGATRYSRAPTVNLAELRERVEGLKHSQIKVIRGMLSEDRETYGGYKERKGHNAALDAVIALIDGSAK